METALPAFSPDERQTLRRLVAEGKTRAEVAEALGRPVTSVVRLYHAARAPQATTHANSVRVGLTDAELEALDLLAGERGVTKNAVLRGALRQAAGMVEIDKAVVAALRDVRNEIAAIGRNLNQLAELGNSGRLKWNARDSRTLAQSLSAADAARAAATRVIEAARVRANVLPWPEEEA